MLAWYSLGGVQVCVQKYGRTTTSLVQLIVTAACRPQPFAARAILASSLLPKLGVFSRWRIAGAFSRGADKSHLTVGCYCTAIELQILLGLTFLPSRFAIRGYAPSVLP
ncbi:hypothetical protein NC00_03120 [Xanthomonas cannabis pv. phaseoli]|uniref:Secreted protein n=1 Tax=Xanthomonas cannabis pv. phaseoli TaxID=1885902 RepID=A0AB34PD21_9XANT|nr:hypothetical protein NC00_03120 [Xanthomonas cannabis pv. phaseoli]PPU37811.1 hypothetical protein XspCFBP7912_01695 [Xanthomonas sp. CFBP 7912]